MVSVALPSLLAPSGADIAGARDVKFRAEFHVRTSTYNETTTLSRRKLPKPSPRALLI